MWVSMNAAYLLNPVRLFLRNHNSENAIRKSTMAEITRPVVNIHFRNSRLDHGNDAENATYSSSTVERLPGMITLQLDDGTWETENG